MNVTYTVLASSEDREAWLEARRGGVTATDISRLITSPAEWSVIRREKAGEVTFKGSRATRWGEEREPVIAEKMTAKYPGLLHNTHTVAKEGSPQYLATPDMIGPESLCQIKTRGLKDGEQIWWEPPTNYVVQCQWEMFVTGRDVNILAVEYHHDYVTDGQVFEYLIRRDDDLIADLAHVADLFLAGESWLLDQRLDEVAVLRKEVEAAQEKLAEAEGLIRKEVGDHAMFAYYSAEKGSIKWSPVKPRETFDKNAWMRDNPDSSGKYIKLSPQKPRLTINTKGDDE